MTLRKIPVSFAVIFHSIHDKVLIAEHVASSCLMFVISEVNVPSTWDYVWEHLCNLSCVKFICCPYRTFLRESRDTKPVLFRQKKAVRVRYYIDCRQLKIGLCLSMIIIWLLTGIGISEMIFSPESCSRTYATQLFPASVLILDA